MREPLHINTYFWLLLALILTLRLLGLGSYPLLDTSEARYAEMARKMVELENWVTPMFSYQQPFWGKPPLAFWAQAGGLKLLDAGAFSLRLSSWIFHVGSCALLIILATRYGRKTTGLLAAIIFSSSTLGVVASGVVLTDPALNFCLLLACFGFMFAIERRDNFFALLGFCGLGLGLLAKGPLILVLFGVPAILWTAYYHRWSQLIALPWFRGITLLLLIAVPWYLLAEQRTPGFLEYFFIGEHWQRFIVSGWQGDLYGSAHARPLGTIWLYFVAAQLPWLLLPLWQSIAYLLARLRECKTNQIVPISDQQWLVLRSLLLLMALTPPLFFSLSQNILWTYVLPALPACALLFADRYQSLLSQRRGLTAVLALLLPVLLVGIITHGDLFKIAKDQRPVVAYWKQHQLDEPLYYLNRHYYSAQFHSAGASRAWPKTQQRNENIIPDPKQCSLYLAAPQRLQHDLLPQSLTCVRQLSSNETHLYRCHRRNAHCLPAPLLVE